MKENQNSPALSLRTVKHVFSHIEFLLGHTFLPKKIYWDIEFIPKENYEHIVKHILKAARSYGAIRNIVSLSVSQYQYGISDIDWMLVVSRLPNRSVGTFIQLISNYSYLFFNPPYILIVPNHLFRKIQLYYGLITYNSLWKGQGRNSKVMTKNNSYSYNTWQKNLYNIEACVYHAISLKYQLRRSYKYPVSFRFLFRHVKRRISVYSLLVHLFSVDEKEKLGPFCEKFNAFLLDFQHHGSHATPKIKTMLTRTAYLLESQTDIITAASIQKILTQESITHLLPSSEKRKKIAIVRSTLGVVIFIDSYYDRYHSRFLSLLRDLHFPIFDMRVYSYLHSTAKDNKRRVKRIAKMMNVSRKRNRVIEEWSFWLKKTGLALYGEPPRTLLLALDMKKTRLSMLMEQFFNMFIR